MSSTTTHAPAATAAAGAVGGPVERLRRLGDLTVPCAIRAAAELGVVDHLIDSPRTADELAGAAGWHPGSLARLLAVLEREGLLERDEAGRVRPTAVGELLAGRHPLSLRDAHLPSRVDVSTWAAFAHCIRTGEPSFDVVHGTDHQSYSDDHPGETRRMDRAYRAAVRIELLTALRVRDWSADRHVVDVGGGSGTFLAGLLRRHRRMHGVLLDLPAVVEAAAANLGEAGVDERCEVIGGDFFTDVPAGADAYILKSVVGAWHDEDAARLLAGIREGMTRDSTLVIYEPVLGYGEEFRMGNVVQLQTLALYGGPDRTEEQFAELAARSGLEVRRIVPRATLPMIEMGPR